MLGLFLRKLCLFFSMMRLLLLFLNFSLGSLFLCSLFFLGCLVTVFLRSCLLLLSLLKLISCIFVFLFTFFVLGFFICYLFMLSVYVTLLLLLFGLGYCKLGSLLFGNFLRLFGLFLSF